MPPPRDHRIAQPAPAMAGISRTEVRVWTAGVFKEFPEAAAVVLGQQVFQQGFPHIRAFRKSMQKHEHRPPARARRAATRVMPGGRACMKVSIMMLLTI